MFNAELAAALKTAREKAGYSQRDVEERTGLTRSWVNSVEGGRVEQPNSDRLKRLAKLYGVHESVFLRLAGYDVDEKTMPTRKESDVILELYVRALARERENGTHDPMAIQREIVEAVKRTFLMKEQREPVLSH